MCSSDLGNNNIEQIWSNDEIRNYIAYSKRLNPIIDLKIAKYFSEKFKSFIGKTKEDDEISHRLRGNIMRWIYAHAKFIGIGNEEGVNINVTTESVDFAFSLMRHSFTLLNQINKEGFVKYEDMEEIPDKKEVNKYYMVKDALNSLTKEYNNIIPEEKILEKINKSLPEFTMKDFDKEIEKLRKLGDTFEPRPRHWGIL